MGKYGDAAIEAAKMLKGKCCSDPVAAWKAAVSLHLPTLEGQKKACPRSVFLGLCEAGLMSEIRAGNYTRSKLNKAYALRAVGLLNEEPSLASDPELLWQRVMAGEKKQSNGQMDVVVSLWSAQLLKVKQG